MLASAYHDIIQGGPLVYIADDLKPAIFTSPVILSGLVISGQKNAILAESSQSLHFKTMFNVDPQYVAQAINMTRIFQNALNASSLQFNTAEAISLAQRSGLTVDQQIQAHFSNGNPGATIDQVADKVNVVLGGTVPSSLKQKILDSISAGFTNLHRHSESAWIFWSKETGDSTSYYYNIMFAIQQGSRLIAIPLGMFIRASVSKEKVLFITVSSSASYSVDLDGLKVSQALSS
ncbi:cytolytic delta-endotoxin [Zooshikella ganghwensis]|uniref:Cytolytic delta-endotoxin n=1 Tax=Zooshikella ganghwensis TaxID=202772 RepID=A0A4P9VMC0_9GAMM|nr:cytolytic delta-endotoxin [Zooshikella ganghwensis]RDH44535.1 cytolytic delta-endotoxin [Zooshikella ganghwensis]